MKIEIKEFPKVSVMIVTYNQIQFIRETIDSVLLQDYENTEIVVSDDASTDGTQEVLFNYLRDHSKKIKIFLNQNNLGITENCNSAFFHCNGDLISLFAGDDVMLPGKISSQVKHFLDFPNASLCYHPVEIFESSTNKTLYITFKKFSENIYSYKDIISGGGFPGITSVMVKKSACPENGFDVRLPTISDWMFVIEVSLKGDIIKVDKILSRYRKHEQGTTRNISKYLDETLKTLDLLMEKYSNDHDFVEICKIGKARYLAGEAFRQLRCNNLNAKKFSTTAVELDPHNKRYRLLKIFTKFPILSRIFGNFLNNNKYIIKRFM